MPTTMPATPTLAELAEAQKDGTLNAFNMAEAARRVTRLQGVYAAKMRQLESFEEFYEATTPDFILRAPDGRELMLRISTGNSGTPLAALREALQEELLELESTIINAHLDYELVASESANERDLRPAILALCMPAATSATTPVTEVPPAASQPLPAGQRLFVTPPTRPAAPAV